MGDVIRAVVTLMWLVMMSLMVTMVATDDIDDITSLSRSNSGMKLKIQEVRKVMRDSDPSGRTSDVKIILKAHDPIPNLSRWGLTVDIGDSFDNHEIPAENETQTDMQFPVDISNVTQFYIVATNSTNNIVALASYKVLQGYLDSRLAWVGGEYEPTGPSSLRVVPGSRMLQVEVVMEEDGEADGVKEVCKKTDSPCYYLSSTSLPQKIPRCINHVSYADGDTTAQCDDVITMYQDMPLAPTLEVINNTLTVTANYTVQPATIEVVVFDSANSSIVYSPEGYKCYLEKQPRSRLTSCTQQLVLPEGEGNAPQELHLPLSILLIALDRDGYVLESRLDTKSEPITKKRDTRGILAACIILACFFGVGLLISGLLYFMHARKEKKEQDNRRGSSKYQRAAISEPPAQAPPSPAATQEEVPLRQATSESPNEQHRELTTTTVNVEEDSSSEERSPATERTPDEPSPETVRATEQQQSPAKERTAD